MLKERAAPAERARLRRGAVPRARDRPDSRPAAESRWAAAGIETSWGQFYIPNLPTEEVFTTPDRRRTEGQVRATQPLVLVGGTVVRDLEMTFENGRVTE